MIKEHGDDAANGGAACPTRADPPEPWSELDRELSRAHRVANHSIAREDLDWLCRGFSAFLASGGKVPLERCLRLPTNERALRRALRDHWLRRAWLQLRLSLGPPRRARRLLC